MDGAERCGVLLQRCFEFDCKSERYLWFSSTIVGHFSKRRDFIKMIRRDRRETGKEESRAIEHIFYWQFQMFIRRLLLNELLTYGFVILKLGSKATVELKVKLIKIWKLKTVLSKWFTCHTLKGDFRHLEYRWMDFYAAYSVPFHSPSMLN